MPVKYTVSNNGMFVHAVAHGVLIPDDIQKYIKEGLFGTALIKKVLFEEGVVISRKAINRRIRKCKN